MEILTVFTTDHIQKVKLTIQKMENMEKTDKTQLDEFILVNEAEVKEKLEQKENECESENKSVE